MVAVSEWHLEAGWGSSQFCLLSLTSEAVKSLGPVLRYLHGDQSFCHHTQERNLEISEILDMFVRIACFRHVVCWVASVWPFHIKGNGCKISLLVRDRH